MEEGFDSEGFKDNLECQLAEVEILESMFPSDKELSMYDVSVISDVQTWISNCDSSTSNTPDLPPLIEFILTLSFGSSDQMELVVSLPSSYPSSLLPDTYVRSNTLSRCAQTNLNQDLKRFLETETLPAEPCLVAVISWLQEHGEEYFTNCQNLEDSTKDDPEDLVTKKMFSRFWIYSHHLYSKIKRRDLLDLASEFQLTGFSMPGKPGIICVEGYSRNCNEWWQLVKHWQWKKINLKIQEDEEIEDSNGEKCRRFEGFKEIAFTTHGSRSNHMDMGGFYTYLESHGSSYMFKELFGVEKSN